MAGEGDFSERMDELRTLVGRGMLEGAVDVNQVYAHYQDSGHGPHGKPAQAFSHPRGGEAEYLSGTLTRKGAEYVQKLADAVGEKPLDLTMIELVEDLSNEVYLRAPRMFWVLRQSAHPTVKSEEKTVYDRPPLMPRLPQVVLNAMRTAAFGDLQGQDGPIRGTGVAGAGLTNLWRRGRVSS